MASLVQWVDIPARDIQRAASFYRTVFGVEMQHLEMPPDFVMEWFMSGDEPLGAGLVQGGGMEPNPHGLQVYLTPTDDLDSILKRVESAGGSIAMGKSGDDQSGYSAFFIDTEGNRIGLHSPS